MLIKKIIPNKIKDLIKKLLNIIDRIIIPINKPFVLKNKLDVNFIFYPWEKNTINMLLDRKDLKKEIIAAKKLIKNGHIVFDVGANTGILSATYSKLTGKKGRVYSFEPIYSTFWQLKTTLALNKCENVVAIKTALSNTIGTAEMQVLNESESGLNSLGKPNYPEYKSIKEIVNVDTVENVCRLAQIKYIDFLKIDVEGFEKEVLEGCNNLLKNNYIKFIQFEISDIPLKGVNKTPNDILNIFNIHNYLVFSFNQNTNKFTGPISSIIIKSGKYDNFYASKQDLNKI